MNIRLCCPDLREASMFSVPSALAGEGDFAKRSRVRGSAPRSNMTPHLAWPPADPPSRARGEGTPNASNERDHLRPNNFSMSVNFNST